LGPTKRTFYYLYVILDVYSRYVLLASEIFDSDRTHSV
jgi:hypothetical protein